MYIQQQKAMFSNSPHNSYLQWLFTMKISRAIFLIVIIILLLILCLHYIYWNDNDGYTVDIAEAARKTLGIDDFSKLGAKDLRSRIEEMLRIRTSVSQELRLLEKKCSKMKKQIVAYNSKIEELKNEATKYHFDLERLLLSVEQAKLAQKESLEKSMLQVKAPARILPSSLDNIYAARDIKEKTNVCTMESCFDFSRCSLFSGFPIYTYINTSSKNSLFTKLQMYLKSNAYFVDDPSKACVFLVLIPDVYNVEKFFFNLSHWNGDGRNHILLLSKEMSTSSIDLDKIDTGKAIIARSFYKSNSFRPIFDIIIPPLELELEDVIPWINLPQLVPIYRKYYMSFLGEINNKFVTSKHVLSLINNDNLILDYLKIMQSNNSENKFYFYFTCSGNQVTSSPGDWIVCDDKNRRESVLRESTFSLIFSPSDNTILSSSAFQIRLIESLKYGAIPVVLGNNIELPLNDVIQWNRAVIQLPKSRIAEMYFFLRTIPDSDLFSMRRQGRLIWENYFCSTKRIISSLINYLRERLMIPAISKQDEPSVSVFNNPTEMIQVEIEVNEPNEEFLGPMVPPNASPSFTRNFSSFFTRHHLKWNDWFDAFEMSPQMPDEMLLPSEAKFLGSGSGFRPVNLGIGGAGREFGEAIGGNVPYEQFTVIILTYEREHVLMNSLGRLYGLPYLNKVVVVWNSPDPPSPDLRWPRLDVPIHVLKGKKNSLNNRFLPYDVIDTEAVLSVDDDAHLRHDEIVFGFRVWREHRDQLVGFPGRFHAWDLEHNSWNYNSNYSCELSMVLTGAAFFHRHYLYLYSQVMPVAIRDMVDKYMNCEDLAMNFLISHITRKPPVKVTSRWTFRCPGCPISLSEDDTHFQERHKCINFFQQVYGYMPLLYTQYRADSVLFKTRLPHDKQKCFKFI